MTTRHGLRLRRDRWSARFAVASKACLIEALLHRRITTRRHAGLIRRRHAQASAPRSGFAGFRFPSGVIMVAVRWYLPYGLSYRDVEELLAERGITVDHVTIYRWVQRFTPLLIDGHDPVGMLREIGGLSMKLRQGCRPVGLPVPGDRPVRPGHRRPRLRQA